MTEEANETNEDTDGEDTSDKDQPTELGPVGGPFAVSGPWTEWHCDNRLLELIVVQHERPQNISEPS